MGAGFDFYLSEMSVSDQHGGGLTMQRILGDDLLQIPLFVHLSRFAEVHPVTDKLKNREIELTTFWDSDFMRRIIGRTRARTMRKKMWVIKNTARRAAKVLNRQFKKGDEVKVLVCPQGANSLYTLEALKKYRPVKYISWVMDDHLVQYVNGQWEYPNGTGQIFAKHLREAEHVFVISAEMQKFYRDRFGVASTILFGPADAIGKTDAKTTNTQALQIGYFGAVAPWQMDALAAVANALESTDTQLHIYSGIEQLPAQLDKPNVRLMARIKPIEVLPIMQQYNAILLPMSFMDQKRHMSEFNIATKMSEYLASGVPILAVGPAYAAMVKYLKANHAAIVIESNHADDIRQGINALHQQTEINNILNNAQKLVNTQTGTVPMCRQWQAGANKFLS